MIALTYHSISHGPPPLCVSPEQLAQQLDTLLEAGYRAVPMAEWRTSAVIDPDRRFAVSFDDGYRDFLEHALPALELRDVPVTLFASASSDRERLAGGIDAPLLSWEELAEVADRGVEIGAHGVAHRDLTDLSDRDLERELRESRALLEQRCGCAVRSLAYPFGAFDRRVRDAARASYESAWTTQLAAVPRSPDSSALPRVDAYYLDSPSLRWCLRRGHPEPYLWIRRQLRRIRGSEPRRGIQRGASGRSNVER